MEASNSDSGDGGDKSDEDDQKCQKTKGVSICNINLTNHDLGNIVNGFPGDAIKDRPFDYCFSEDNIIKNWIAVGFMPITGNAANDPKVRHELGEGAHHRRH